MKKHLLLILITLSFILVSSNYSHAQIDLFLKITDNNGNIILGESQITGHINEVDVLAWSQSSSNCPVGSPAACAPTTGEFSFTTYYGRHSNLLRKSLYLGLPLNEVVFSTVMPNAGNPKDYIKIILTQVSVTSISEGGSGGEDRFAQNINLDARIIKWIYYRYNPNGTFAGTTEFTYNRNTNTGS